MWFKKSTPWKSEETKLGGGHRARTTIFFKAKPGNFEDWCQFMKAKDKKHVFVTKLFYTVSGSVTPLVGMGETIWTDSEKNEKNR